MSHDQRPARIRVVGNGARAPARAGDAARTAAPASAAAAGNAATAGAEAPGAASGPASFPIFTVLVFLLACAIGGVAIVAARNYGLIG